MEIVDVLLQAPLGSGGELTSFYVENLGLEHESAGEIVAIRIGSSHLAFAPTDVARAEPFYHFALLVPGDRFAAAYDWLGKRTRLLPDPETGDAVFDFDKWNALACYCLDPVGNIVELIAHRGIGDSAVGESFSSAELLGISELGLVGGDKREVADTLLHVLGVHVWDGEIDDPQRLAFVGERARTLILSPEGRPWLPTDRPAEMHRVEFVLHGVRTGDALLPGTPHRVSGSSLLQE